MGVEDHGVILSTVASVMKAERACGEKNEGALLHMR